MENMTDRMNHISNVFHWKFILSIFFLYIRDIHLNMDSKNNFFLIKNHIWIRINDI